MLIFQNNPSEARQMLLQNPQLAYALLQAMVVMRIVDPQTASVSISSIAPSDYFIARNVAVGLILSHCSRYNGTNVQS